MTTAKLHSQLIEQTLVALNEPTIDSKLKLYHLIGLWLDLHPQADVYERFKARTALHLLKDSLGDSLEVARLTLQDVA